MVGMAAALCYLKKVAISAINFLPLQYPFPDKDINGLDNEDFHYSAGYRMG